MEGGKWRRRKRGLLNNGIKVHVHVRERGRKEGRVSDYMYTTH